MQIKEYQLVVNNIIKETNNAAVIQFENIGNQVLSYQAGQFLTLVLNIENKEERRAYSLCTSPVSDTLPAVCVKRVEQGKMSNFLLDQVQIGDKLKVLEPMGFFITDFSTEQKRHFVLFAGGSGITPLISILKTALELEKESVVSLIYQNTNEESIIFKQELEDLKEKYAERLNIAHVLSQSSANWSGLKGRLSAGIISDLLEQFPKLDNTDYFMCGPKGMMDIIAESFETLGLPKDKLKKESFGISLEEASGNQDDTKDGDSSEKTVKILYDNEEHVITVPADKTILQTALDLDIDLPYSCQAGMCTACMGKCTSGKVELEEEDALTPGELNEGYILTCVGHPLTDDVVIEIE